MIHNTYRNEESPFKGIDTFLHHIHSYTTCTIEMKRARLRALIHTSSSSDPRVTTNRNEESPFKGIDTHSVSSLYRTHSHRNEESPLILCFNSNCNSFPFSNSKLLRPYMILLSTFSLFTLPSASPLL